jgi:hypothetical protein
MSVFRCRDERLIKGRAHSIVECDDKGQIIGTYIGYYNPDIRTVTLYPDYRHPGLKPGVKLVKKKIYDGSVRCNTSSVTAGGASLSSTGEGVKNATAGLRRLPFVQERIKF